MVLSNAIQEFTEKRLAVYRADPQQIVRDTRAAERATGDHAGRWLFELLQNSDDAGATEVLVLVEDDAVYVADNGRGLKPEAVSAICGTDFSDKTTGTIGRKGVGFKSVYEVSRNPQVLTVGGEGIEFCRDKAKAWLKQNSLDDHHVPYQWIPFFLHWNSAQQVDPKLGSFTNYKTVIRLGGVHTDNKRTVQELIKRWPPHALFAFRHLRQIKAPDLEVVLSAGDGVWSLRDSRGQTPDQWRVTRLTEHPPADLLEVLGTDERRAIVTDGVGFLIAAPFKNNCVAPTTDYLPVHVFYPTEQKGPVPLLLHAEFLVKSDRTALMPVDGNPFNAWVADRLAYHVCKFVNESYRAIAPSSYATLLVPFADRASHPVAADLWQRMADKAQTDLRLADVEARPRLTIGEARLISVSVRADLARTLLEATNVRERLLHPAFDDDKAARITLRELGCKEIHDQDLMATIAENADSLATDTQWVGACWEWLAGWVAKERYGEEQRKRIESVKALPVVPIDGSLVKASDLAGRIVTWKPDAGVGNLPDWLPLTFVDDWFRDHIQAETQQESPAKKLCGELGITEPGADVIQRAVGRAIEQYWKDKQGDPGRFLRFILEQDWHETSEASSALQRCPVRLSKPMQGEPWAEAGKAYFGREWKNDLLADLYAGIETVAWVATDGMVPDSDKQRQVLEWLDVAHCPRLVSDPSGQEREVKRIECALPYHKAHDPIPAPCVLEHVDMMRLAPSQAVAMVKLFARYWLTCYTHHSNITIKYRYGSWYAYSLSSTWWDEVRTKLSLPLERSHGTVSLRDCWLPDKRTERDIGDLLPIIDLDAFGDDKDVVRDWLVSAAGLRERMEQLTVEEWKELLSTRIPRTAPGERVGSDERLRDKVTRWYAACLMTMEEQDKVSQEAFASCPLLCRKGGVWQYVADESRYLDDDNLFATAFGEDVWLFHIPNLLVTGAVKYLGIRPLSQSVGVDVTPGEPQSPLSDGLLERLDKSLPYVWAWRSSQSKQADDRLSAQLMRLSVLVVPALKASLSLGDVHHEVEKPWHVEGDTIHLQRDHQNEAELSQALAKALEVRSEADFYENLLRCTDDSQRKKKLLSKGMMDADVERCLREYEGRQDEEEQERGTCTGEASKGATTTPPSSAPALGRKQAPSGEGKILPGTSQAPSTADSQTQQSQSPAGEEQGKPLRTSDARGQPLRLKDTSTCKYELGTPPELLPEHAGGGGGGSGGTGHEGYSLTDRDKAILEEAGREIAAHELDKLGFSVEKMPPDNPGFDLRARRDGEELHIEVKAHTGRATVVDVTHRQHREYLRQQGYRWELWNVEHLAENDINQVVLTRYDTIPDDALDTRMFRVDLKKCHPLPQV